MESVAKSVQGPIKILFVSAWADPTTDPPTKLKTSLLGLGDIVVPGTNLSVLYSRPAICHVFVFSCCCCCCCCAVVVLLWWLFFVSGVAIAVALAVVAVAIAFAVALALAVVVVGVFSWSLVLLLVSVNRERRG